MCCYNILRCLKDSLIITSAGVGVEVIPYLKTTTLMPLSIIIMTSLTKLYNHIDRERLFYFTISFFLLFYFVFAFYLYPKQDLVQPSMATINQLKQSFPRIQHFFSIFQVWVLVTFYVMAELWTSVTISLFFWEFANEISKKEEAKRFYGMYALVGHIGPIVGASITTYFSNVYLANGSSNHYEYVQTLMTFVIGFGILALLLFRFLNRNILTNAKHYERYREVKQEKSVTKLSVRESIKYVFRSKYLGLIFLLVLCYGASMNVLGNLWKNQVKTFYPTTIEYNKYLSLFFMATSISTVFFAIILRWFLDRFGWYWGAITTPIILLVVGLPYLAMLIFGQENIAFLGIVFENPVFIMFLFISLQQMLGKGAKYAVFDPTKEMAYIPLDKELRTKGKAAVDVVGYTFAKSSGGWILIGLYAITQAASVQDLGQYIAVICFVFFVLWIWSVNKLDIQFNKESNKE